MEDVEYLNMSCFLQNISGLIARRDWLGFMSFIDDIGCLNIETDHYDFCPENQDLYCIKDIAGHLKAVKDIVLEQAGIVSHRSET